MSSAHFELELSAGFFKIEWTFLFWNLQQLYFHDWKETIGETWSTSKKKKKKGRISFNE